MALHWHVVICGPPQHRDALARLMKDAWERMYGNADVRFYDPQLPGTYYLAKTADSPDFIT